MLVPDVVQTRPKTAGRIVSVRGGSRTVTPSVPRHAAWPAAGGPERHGLAGTAPEIRPRSQMAAKYLETDLAKGTGAVSAHVGTTPLQPDAVWQVALGSHGDGRRAAP